jgi:hypothetical protein
MRTPRPAATTFRLLLVALVALGASALAQAQAGRVVLAVGDVVSVRGAERVRLAAGATLNVGDAVVTGADGHAQIRFNDDALVALKPGSEFRIEAWSDPGVAGAGARAVFRLVRGGFRTITGRVGQVDRDAYQVLTTQATIGIRGTHYQLELCEPGACRETPDAAPVAGGLYGGVYDGKIVAITPSASTVFGEREFFVVPDGGVPARLIAPPSFLASRAIPRQLVARAGPARVGFRKVPAFPVGDLDPLNRYISMPYVANEDLDRGESFEVPFAGIVGSDDATLEFLLAIGSDQVTTDALGRITAIATPTLAANLGTASLLDVGSNIALGANLNWGRWSGPGSTIVQTLPNGDRVNNDGGNLHYIYGVTATDLPTSGIVEFAAVGGTNPTDSSTGAVGTLISGGRVGVNFGTATVTLTNLQVGFTNATYTMSGDASLFGPLFSTGGNGASASCAGSACQVLVAGNFAGFLSGPGAAGLGLDYYFSTRTGTIEGVAGYRRCAAPGAC